MDDDVELLRLYAQEKSEEAFAALVRRHIDLVHSSARRRVGNDEHLARDVTQKVFIALARQAPSLSVHRSLAGWLYVTTRNSAAHVVRTERRRRMREERAHIMNETNEDTTNWAEWERLRPELDEVMDQLSSSDREAVLLRYFSGCAFSEVAEKLGLSEEAARKRVSRGLEKLRSLLTRRGVTSSSVAIAAVLSRHAITAAPAQFAAAISGTALAAAKAAAPGLSLLRFFGSAKTAAGFAGAMALAVAVNIPAIAAAAYEGHQAHAARAALAGASRDYASQLGQLAALRASASAAADPSPAAAQPVHKFLQDNPEVRAMLMEAGMSGALRTNGLFYRLAGFTPAQTDRFQRLLVESWVDQMQLVPPVSGQGVVSDADLRSVVGDETFREFQDYTQMTDAYLWTAEAARQMNFNDAPLTADQARDLAQILANNSSIYRGGGSLNQASVDSGAAAASVDWPAALQEARAILSASQWQSAQPVFLNFELDGELNRARAGGGAAAVAPAGPQ